MNDARVEPVIWNSTLLMSLFDVFIIGCAIYVVAGVLRQRPRLQAVGLFRLSVAIAVGIGVIAGIYIADLVIMNPVKWLTSVARSREIMEALYLNVSWIVTFAGVGVVAFGMHRMFTTTVPEMAAKIAALRGRISESEDRLSAQSKVEDSLRVALGKRERALERRAEELRKLDGRLQRETDLRRLTARRLNESETRFGSVADGSVQGIMVISNDWKVLYVNDAFVELLGYPSREVLVDRLRFESFYAPHEFDRMNAYREARFRGETAPVTYEVDVVRADGTAITLYNAIQLTHWDGQAAKQFAAVDITERKRAERELRNSERRYRDLIEQSVQGILIHRDWKLLFVNRALARMLGYDSVEEVLALGTVDRIFASGEHARLRAYYAARKAGRPAPEHYEVEAQHKDGSTVVLQNVVRNVEWDGADATQANVIDVTDRRRAEERLKQNEQLYRKLVEGSVQGLVILKNFKPVFANDAYARLLGFESAEALLARSSLRDVYAPHELERVAGYWKRRAAGESAPDQYEVDMVTTSGETVTVLNVVREISWGGELAAQISAIDITARRRYEDERKRLTGELRARIRQLSGLKQLAARLQRNGLSRTDTCSVAAYMLKRACQWPEITEVRVEIDGVEGATPDWRPTDCRLEHEFSMPGGGNGRIEVCLIEDPPPDAELFLQQERSLLNSVCDMLSSYLDRQYSKARLGEHTAQLAGILESVHHGIVLVDAAGRVVRFNRRCRELFELPDDGFDSDMSFEEFAAHQAVRLADAGSDQGTGKREFMDDLLAFDRHPLERSFADGTIVEIHGTPRDDGGFVMTFTDITARRLAEDRAEESRALLYSAFKSLSEAVFVIDPEGRKIVSCNPAAARMFGYSEEALTGRTTEILHVDHASFVRFGELREPHLKRGETFRIEYPMRHKNGDRLTAEITVDLIDEARGLAGGVVSVLRDVTEQRRMERLLRSFEKVISASASPMFYIDRDYTYRIVNDAGVQWYGRPREEVVGRTLADILGAKPFREWIKGKFDLCLAGEVVDYESELDYPGKGRVRAAVHYEPCRDEYGRVTGAAVTLRELRPRKRQAAPGRGKTASEKSVAV